MPVLLAIAAAVFALDLWTKHWATQTLAGGPPVSVIGDLVRFTYVRNSGVAFGLGAGLGFPFYLFSIAAVLAILYLFVRGRVHGRGRRIALALILGGALGNLVDRITAGEVVDFIDIGWGRWHWPVFNVADSAVSIGVVLFALAWPHRGADARVTADPEAGTTPAAHAEENAIEERDAGAGPLGPAARQRGATGPLPGGGAGGPLA